MPENADPQFAPIIINGLLAFVTAEAPWLHFSFLLSTSRTLD
jgi:hypothetical protein